MLCPNCGNALDEGARHCRGCGARVGESSSKANGKARSLAAHFVSDIVVAAVALVVIIVAVVRWLVATFPV